MFQRVVIDEFDEALARDHQSRVWLVLAAVGWVRSSAWLLDGARSPVSWLVARHGLDTVDARRLVRRARLVDQLNLSDELAAGAVTIGQVDVLCRRIGFDSEIVDLACESRDLILEWCKLSHLADFDRAAHHWRLLADDLLGGDADRSERRRYLRLHRNLFGELEFDGRTTADDGTIIEAALEAAITPDVPEVTRTRAQRLVDALVELCAHALGCEEIDTAAGSRSAGEPVVIIDQYGQVEYQGTPMARGFAERVCCDARVAHAWRDETSNELRFGRTRRTPTESLRRAVVTRDRHCRFPGCRVDHSRCHVHHIDEWAQGGATDIDNLTLMCCWHHRLIHEGGWTLRGSPTTSISARSPDGRTIT